MEQLHKDQRMEEKDQQVKEKEVKDKKEKDQRVKEKEGKAKVDLLAQTVTNQHAQMVRHLLVQMVMTQQVAHHNAKMNQDQPAATTKSQLVVTELYLKDLMTGNKEVKHKEADKLKE